MTELPYEPARRGIPPWRWAWMGFGFAALLWIGSSIYFQRINQLEEIESQSEPAERQARFQRNARNLLLCKVGAGILTLASLTYLVSQLDMRQPRPPERR